MQTHERETGAVVAAVGHAWRLIGRCRFVGTMSQGAAAAMTCPDGGTHPEDEKVSGPGPSDSNDGPTPAVAPAVVDGVAQQAPPGEATEAQQRLSAEDVALIRLLVDLRSHVAHHQRAVPGCIVAIAVRPTAEPPSGEDSDVAAAGGRTATSGRGKGEVVCWGYVRSMLQEAQLSRKHRPVTDLHAEGDCVTAAARHGIALFGATMYVSSIPCLNCFQLMVAAGIKRVVHPPPPHAEFYSKDAPHCLALAKRHGVEVVGDILLPPHRKVDAPPDVPFIERALGERD